jgi:heat-inducible transcriptional repressor
MTPKRQMTTRAAEVLHSIVRSYIENGEPVASRDVSFTKESVRGGASVMSAATIRNVMAELSDEGYLTQPHTSAGRIPTKKAFEHYIESLAAGRMVNAELDRLRQDLQRAQTVERQVERSSQVLSSLTQNVGIAAAIPATSQLLEQIELLLLPDRRVLMIVATGDKMVRNRVTSLEGRVTQEELNSIRNYVNREFAGWQLDDIRRELERRLEHESSAYDAILRTLTQLYNQGLLDLGLTPEIHLEGTSNLIGLDLSLTRETMRELFRALEQKKKILQLLDQFNEAPPGEVTFQIGLGDVHPAMAELSLIGVTVTLPSGLNARLAVLGPLRMDYSRVISAVQGVGKALDGL